MANGNGEVKKTKKCPFLGEWCIKEQCAIYTSMTKRMGGMQQTVGGCAYIAMITLLSEINAKTVEPQSNIKKIVLPGM